MLLLMMTMTDMSPVLITMPMMTITMMISVDGFHDNADMPTGILLIVKASIITYDNLYNMDPHFSKVRL